jgi:uncharacterized YigZ family protein
MNILSKYVCFEESIKNSRFLSELIPCTSQSQAREIIKEQKKKYADSTHVVHAFVVGNGAEICGMSDDGEPSGTAGRPVLDVLKGKNCTNVILTVTRWFGGTLLGTGGLVKAYSGGAKQVLEVAEDQNAFEPLVQKKSFKITLDYSLLKPIKIRMENYHFFDVEEIFDTQVHIQGQIKEDEYSAFTKEIFEFSNGRIIIE